METFFSQIEWAPVLVSTIVAFMVGWAWYSPKLFYEKWQNGLPKPPVWHAPMWMPMFAQFGSTLFLAIIINFAMQAGYTTLIVLIVFTIAGFIKANGMYSGKTKMAISIEATYILVMSIIIYVTNLLV